MKRGDNTFTIIFFLAAIAGLGVLAYGYIPIMITQYHMKQEMQDYMRRLGNLGEDTMIDTLIEQADVKYDLQLDLENFEFDGEVGRKSRMVLEYDTVVDFLFTRRLHHVKIEQNFVIPDNYAG